MEAPNLLVLDEPTNDLDISTLTILEDYLKDFPGILVTVSHDRYFLDKLAGRIFAFEGNGKISQYEGNFSDYKTACRIKQAELTQDHSKEKNAKNSKAEKPDCTQVQSENNTKTTQTKNNWRTPSTTLKFTYKEQKEYDTIDNDIAALEEKLSMLNEEIAKNSSNYSRLTELSAQKEDAEAALNEKMERWVYLNDLAEKISAQKK